MAKREGITVQAARDIEELATTMQGGVSGGFGECLGSAGAQAAPTTTFARWSSEVQGAGLVNFGAICWEGFKSCQDTKL